MAIVRVREHVNPLSRKYQKPVELPTWSTVFPQLDRPLHLDIGCGRGRFLLGMAQLQPDWNFLGLEIRAPIVQQANDWAAERGVDNLFYLFCNVNISLPDLLNSLPTGTLSYVTIQFPDPWFKRRHQKRRVVQPEVVTALAHHLVMGSQVFIQSDIEEVAQEMDDRFAEHPAFQRHDNGQWLPDNPLPLRTEREISTLRNQAPVYRALFTKTAPASAEATGV